MHKTKSPKSHSPTYSTSLFPNSYLQLAYRPFGSQLQKSSVAPKTQTEVENVAFAQQHQEATGLSIQAKSSTITPEGQERLTILKAQMDGLLNSRLSHATRFGHNIANIPLRRPDTPTPIQTKLTIGEPGDKYQQEADETARQVVQRIHQLQGEKVQRESFIEDEELQMKPMVQHVADSGTAAISNLETSIQQERGSGQPLADRIKSPMEQAFGADFSGVKVHTDTQADQLNQSIQAKAFTTGQDVFFRQGAYQPGSRDGQELLAHELTHVVQQNGGAVQRSPQPQGQLPQHPVTETPSVLVGDGEIEERGEMTGNSQVLLSMKSVSLAIDAAAICQNSTQNVVQRQVFKSRKTSKYYSDRDESRQFDSKAEAEEYDRLLSNDEKQKRTDQEEQKKAERIKKRRLELEEQYKDYTPPLQSKKARLYKENDKKYDDIGVTLLTRDNVKQFMEKQFADRRAGQFQTQVIELGGHYHVIAPGTDIGLTPALLRPDINETPKELTPLSRQGNAKTYNALSQGLDEIVKNNTTDERNLKETRQRIGKDIMRITRSNPVEGSIKYTKEELEILNEVAAVLRLDKGRVPKATKYITNTITGGEYSFTDLLGSPKKYVGAGKGGVENLRGKTVENGYESEGSDIEMGGSKEEIETGNKKADGEDYHPTAELNQQLQELNLGLNWVTPDGFCIFNSLGAATNQTGVEIQQRILAAIDNNTNDIQNWITTTYGGGGFETVANARQTVMNITNFWRSPRADIVLPLVAEVLQQGFTVVQDNQPAQDIRGGGQVLVRVRNPNEHYHATRPR
ncbi:eCIS core domain-containing protein [Nostoc sp.]|uniref:eCIS core domain-containing protein n=1 Tax=Nostoc sp. TaxID=1180 RepID=UPI002FFBB9BB